MTNALGIAAVTAVLVDRLRDAVVNAADAAGAIEVSAIAPARFAPDGPIDPGTRLNLFVYRVERNQGWANNGQPERSAAGERRTRPYLPVDLHYLLSAYGDDNFEAEVLLGFGMQMMHEHCFFDRQAIRTSLGGGRVQAGGLLPQQFAGLPADSLADQLEQVRVVPHQLKPDEEWRLWEALRAGLRPSATYKASVVLLQLEGSTRPALPVQEPQLFVETMRRPRITVLGAMVGANDPPVLDAPVRRGEHLSLGGSGLAGPRTLVRFGQPQVDDLAAVSVTDDRIVVRVPDALWPGPTSVQVVHAIPRDPADPAAGTIPFELSNTAVAGVQPGLAANPFQLANRVDQAGGTVDVDLTVRLDRPIGARQRATVLANEVDLAPNRAAAAFTADGQRPAPMPADPAATVDRVTFLVRGVRRARYYVRVRVDGIDSPLELGPNAPVAPQPLDLR